MNTLHNINVLNADFDQNEDVNIKKDKSRYTSDIDPITVCGIYVNVLQKISKKILDLRSLADEIYRLFNSSKAVGVKNINKNDSALVAKFVRASDVIMPMINDLVSSLSGVLLMPEEHNATKRLREGVLHFRNLSDMFFLTYNSKYATKSHKVAESICEEFKIVIKLAANHKKS